MELVTISNIGRRLPRLNHNLVLNLNLRVFAGQIKNKITIKIKSA
jgi:hypothetical protein